MAQMAQADITPPNSLQAIADVPRWWLRRKVVGMFVLGCAFAASIGLAICLGASNSTPSEVVRIFGAALGVTSAEELPPSAPVVMHLRAPRVLLAVIVGMTLGVAGAASQGVFRNPLADPGLVGIGGGAMVAVVIMLTLGHRLFGVTIPPMALQFAAFAGALVCAMLVQLLATSHMGVTSASLVLAGVAINTLCSAVVGMLFVFANESQLRSATFWSLGSLGAASWPSLAVVALPMLLCSTLLLFGSRTLDALQLGDSEASLLGVPVRFAKHCCLALVAMGVGAAVSLTGLIGFVGLVIPHAVRLALGASHRIVLPASALAGATLLVLADTFARTVAAPAELPIGALTAVIGAPFFLWLLVRSKNGVPVR